MAALGQVRFLTIHCAATPEGRDVPADDIAKWDIAKFGQESYHQIVTLDGVAHRRLADTVKGAHVGGANTGNIGICCVGGVDKATKPKDTRTPAQVATLARLVKKYRAKYPGVVVRGHNEWPAGGDHAAPSSLADRERASTKAGIIALFDRRIEGVHVDVDDLADGLAGHDASLA
jgi:N-acetyl-anhydromuramyl-L-alanine amidase AmpD